MAQDRLSAARSIKRNHIAAADSVGRVPERLLQRGPEVPTAKRLLQQHRAAELFDTVTQLLGVPQLFLDVGGKGLFHEVSPHAFKLFSIIIY